VHTSEVRRLYAPLPLSPSHKGRGNLSYTCSRFIHRRVGVVFGVAGFAALAGLTCIAVAAAMVLTLLWLPDWAEHHA
jgi:hypothetical protein